MDISLINILFLLIPLLLLVYSLKLFNIKIMKTTIISVSRMIIQLLLVGVYLQYIFKFDNPIINFLYILVMISVASSSINNLTKLNYKKMVLPIFISLITSWFIIYSIYSLLVLNNVGFLQAQYMIPISGMFIGNVLRGQIILLNLVFSNIKNNEESYFYLLSMGATKFEALRGFYKEGLLASINPSLAGMATMGLAFLPGMMTGQVLAGASPFIAIKYQISIMIAIFLSRTLSLIFTIFMVNKFCFDDFSRIKQNIFK